MSAPAAPAAAVGGGGCGVEWSGQAGELGGATDNAQQARESRPANTSSHTLGERNRNHYLQSLRGGK